MTANNWSECPKCLRKAAREREALRQQAEASYGKVSAAEYREMVEKAEADDEVDRRSLREDWEIGVGKDGEFFLRYYCGCGVCGFEFSFRHKDQALKREDD